MMDLNDFESLNIEQKRLVREATRKLTEVALFYERLVSSARKEQNLMLKRSAEKNKSAVAGAIQIMTRQLSRLKDSKRDELDGSKRR